MKLKKIKEIIMDYAQSKNEQFFENDFWEKKVSIITSDSREVTPGSVFIALKGVASDGHDYINQAITKGAILIIGENSFLENIKIPYICVEDARAVKGLCAAAFYGFPSSELKIIGVTGTSGKTTTAFLIESLLKTAGFEVGLMGTVFTRWKGHSLPSSHTTPEAGMLQKLLFQMKSDGVNAVVMEVSSHALEQKRVFGVDFDVSVFTNLSSEHMDYHQTIESYFQAKAILFSDKIKSRHFPHSKKTTFVIHGDDLFGARLIQECSSDKKIITFGKGMKNHLSTQALESSLQGIKGSLLNTPIKSPLIGNFNSENISAAFAVGEALGVDRSLISKGIFECKKIPGRLEEVKPGNKKGIKVLVDYAHKPDALLKVLEVLREVANKSNARLVTVIGCGGDRDKTKRPVMAKTASELSDFLVLTSDNPRTEDPLLILEDMKKGIQDFKKVKVEPDRKKAISHAINFAKKPDIVLIAGKGHEDYQIIFDPNEPNRTKKIWFDDVQVASEFI